MKQHDELTQRCWEFTLAIERDAVERVEEHDWGVAHLSPGIPDIWSANYLVFRDGSLGAARIAEIAEELMGAAGLNHRAVSFANGRDGAALKEDFAALGWNADNSLFMALTGEPELPVPDDVVVAHGPRPAELERRALMDDEHLQEESRDLERTVTELMEWERRVSEAAGDDWHTAAPAEGEPGSLCALFRRGDVAQVENVSTVAAARNRGLARAAILGACRTAREEGFETIFIVADADDWPRKLYARLGFEEIGTVTAFRRTPGA